jgi:valyl-tRNA synthetase
VQAHASATVLRLPPVMTQRIQIIDPTTLPSHFEPKSAEVRWDETWQSLAAYRWDPSKGRADNFVIDTPPPTVSGSLHLGHVFSYTQTDVVARHQRMLGKNVFYPMGWDDNGLPTERRVQVYFHVRCDANVAYEPGLTLEPATDEKRKGEKPRLVSRQNFIDLCHIVTGQDEKVFEGLFRRLALSVDWSQTYATIDDRCRHLAQLSFLDLFEKKRAYQLEAPTMWDVDFQTAVAQAEVADKERPGAYHHLEFGIEGSDESFVIATTRPELLPACVAVCAHPDDARYKHLFGKNAVTPLFFAPVKIFPSELADPTKGSGILMVCTFGDQTDVLWWREQKLPLRQILGRDGRLREVTFGTTEYPSQKPEAANAFYAQLQGKAVNQAQKSIVELLKDPSGSATAHVAGKGSAPLQGDPKPITHAVRFYEKGDRPLEFVTSRQWFVRLLDQKQELLEKGDAINWHPEFMRSRYRNWTENLGIDWCVSRQRYFGVPIPAWYPVLADGTWDYEHPILPEASRLPVDPMSQPPTGFMESQRNQPGGFAGDPDVFDTWFTSSLTPQIGSHWLLDPERHAKLFPADVRPQSHEIIRTWAFYTIAKAMLHEGQIPWRNVAISGWILAESGKKMGKSEGNAVTPIGMLDEYGSDSVRYWAGSARLGMDTKFDDKVLKVGKRLVTKLFNAGKYVLSQDPGEGDVSAAAITEELDRAFIAELRTLVKNTTSYFAEFDYAHALMDTEQFFWSRFTDTYLELVKFRARGEESPAGRRSAVATLRLALNVLLRLFAPFVPYVTDEVWSWAFAAETGQKTVHRTAWPTEAELATIPAPEDAESLAIAIDLYATINKKKTEQGASVGRAIKTMRVATSPERWTKVGRVLTDVLAAARCAEHVKLADARTEATFSIDGMEILPKLDKAEAKAD